MITIPVRTPVEHYHSFFLDAHLFVWAPDIDGFFGFWGRGTRGRPAWGASQESWMWTLYSLDICFRSRDRPWLASPYDRRWCAQALFWRHCCSRAESSRWLLIFTLFFSQCASSWRPETFAWIFAAYFGSCAKMFSKLQFCVNNPRRDLEQNVSSKGFHTTLSEMKNFQEKEQTMN